MVGQEAPPQYMQDQAAFPATKWRNWPYFMGKHYFMMGKPTGWVLYDCFFHCEGKIDPKHLIFCRTEFGHISWQNLATLLANPWRWWYFLGSIICPGVFLCEMQWFDRFMFVFDRFSWCFPFFMSLYVINVTMMVSELTEVHHGQSRQKITLEAPGGTNIVRWQ